MKIPDGVRLCQKVPNNECNVCNLSTEDHTVNFNFPVADNSASDKVAYLKVCLKDWAKYKKEAIMAREELKVSIIIKGDHIFLGAQATDCDPKMTTLTGDLAAALARIPSFIEESNAQWDLSARNPKSTIPEVVTPAPVRTATTSPSSVAKPAAKQPAQPNFF
jgi:hypothetical protein